MAMLRTRLRATPTPPHPAALPPAARRVDLLQPYNRLSVDRHALLRGRPFRDARNPFCGDLPHPRSRRVLLPFCLLILQQPHSNLPTTS
jgi:hypothetical protein